ncbi:glycoside hydrolase family 95 protein [Belliella sp. DSM 111904]|uniref:Glycoside hydrolase family 95 protein n=1 Tax=Belliella filtrata TaxID=2923435 RepID=A0ABS9V4E6_9BACT|nr:glycoside hydrolase family 95 protein [Belliella filtrata]MCH7411060.1 glycoside hydrolase family 95 protein [Belliella filtrata]
MLKKTILLFIIILEISQSYGQIANDLKLWYQQPSGETWENALPIGNGRLGAMIYGNTANEIIQLNEETVWSGSPNRNDNPDALNSLSKIQDLIFKGEYKKAEELAKNSIQSKKSHGQMYQTVGNLLLNFDGHHNPMDYHRELDISNAIHKTRYKIGQTTYHREAFASLTDDVIVIKISADKKSVINFKAKLTSPHKSSSQSVEHDSKLILTGKTSNHEGVEGLVRFKTIAEIRNFGGKIKESNDGLSVEKADSVHIFISTATNFKRYDDISGDENYLSEWVLDKVDKNNYQKLKNTHIEKYKQYFDRVSLQLGSTNTPNIPTDVRLKAFKNGNDPQFVALYFQYGRYLLISSSQPGGQPANLQGIWNQSINPPWDSKYTININAQMNYWPAERTNLSELHEPFLTMVEELAEAGEKTAKDMYGTRGWMAHHNTDIWRITGSVDDIFWGIWNGGGGWISQHLWEHYLYTGDEFFLKRIYPVLKGSALFYMDFLTPHPEKDWLVVNPGTSPENAPKAHEGTSLDAGTTMDNQIAFDVFSTALQAGKITGENTDFLDSLKAFRDKLPPMHIGKHGQLQEWLDDIDDPNDKHRHISHLYGLFPSNQISPFKTPELASASEATLNHRGDISTGWSMGWKVNWWARLLDGNRAYTLIKNQLSPASGKFEGGGSYSNLFDAHPPFQIDGNFGCTSGIAEMLLQSANGEIHLLPAIPDEWDSGKVNGLLARGGFEIINLTWENGVIEDVSIKSNLGGNLRIRSEWPLEADHKKGLGKASGNNSNPFFKVEQTRSPIITDETAYTRTNSTEYHVYDVSTEQGSIYNFSISKNLKKDQKK